MIDNSRVAVVSGGATGIGREVARTLAGHGDRVVIIGRRAGLLDQAAEETNRALGAHRVIPVAADLTDPAQVRRAADRIAELGPVGVLVNNAGAIITPPADEGLEALAAAWRRDLDTNLITAVLLTNALLEHLSRPGGRLIFVSSAAAQRGGAGSHSAGSYAAAKAALHGWALGLARQLGGDGITVNVLAPGYIQDTDIFAGRDTPEFVAAKIADTLVGRTGTPADVAAAIRYIASADAGYLTGQIIGLNGGAVLGR
ncbi:SDR family NAD(P)-dependent oxidoreductase [Couchioplanes caeruleus]|uniref:Short-chain dehydrogenase n=2 Tax=Couchioplanes caeruleus TaxID=56438 RepID=A0A1K0GDE2_9ACTN|nr:SDR family oxidoreductase [Couchioplanes caeruleus]OJF10166.1 short-chain dehydrogenase [Couchioplanes caeruleus subsp. caeruleus]ROP33057.1 3-oxoacyl-[acyl-carrier protein] reductase [Couchioplanes caeruleus]